MKLPYHRATTGRMAQGEMQSMLRRVGASSFGVMEEYDAGELIVQFEWRSRRVTLKASVKGYAAAWLREHPYTKAMRCTRAEHEARAMRQANLSVWSILRDWLKGQVTAIEIGMIDFDAAFLAQIVLPDGGTVLERVKHTGQLPQLEGPK